MNHSFFSSDGKLIFEPRSVFLLFDFAMTITMRSWFRTLAAGFKSAAPAQTVSGLATLILVLYTGYTIPQPSMIGALRWITYINVSSCFIRIFYRCLTKSSAAPVWFRVLAHQRVPYVGWHVLFACSARSWL